MTWESMPLGEFVTLKRGYDLPSSLRVNGPVPVVSSSGVTGCHDAAKVKGPGVVTGRYGTLGEVFFIDEDFWPLNTALYVQDFQGNFALMDREVTTNQGFINIIPHDERMRMYLLFNLMSRVAEIRGNAKGTTYPEISKVRFRTMDIVIPEAALLQEFSDTASEIVRQVRLLKRSTLQLGRARDLLLPRLINGELEP